MTTLQNDIKLMLEKMFFDFTRKTLIVEFVEDVSTREKEIIQELGVEMSSTYDASHYTGCFLPPNDKTTIYTILIQKDRQQDLYLMTAFHEFQHAILYFHLYQLIFHEDLQNLKSNSINATFQIYSEFSACKEGTANYIKFVDIDGVTKQMMGESLVEQQLDDYKAYLNTSSGYEFLMHFAMIYGTLFGARDAIENFPFEYYLKQIEGIELLEDICSHMDKYTVEFDWFEKFDFLIKDFLDV